jgi:hypothetical protein
MEVPRDDGAAEEEDEQLFGDLVAQDGAVVATRVDVEDGAAEGVEFPLGLDVREETVESVQVADTLCVRVSVARLGVDMQVTGRDGLIAGIQVPRMFTDVVRCWRLEALALLGGGLKGEVPAYDIVLSVDPTVHVGRN